MIKVSIIVAVYNVEPYLRRCMDSLCKQTLKDIEIICIDDCSTDNSLEILKEYEQSDNRIKLIELKENSGAAVARNLGLKNAKGDYLYFFDADDYLDLTALEKVYNKIKSNDADICIFKNNRYRQISDKFESCHWSRFIKNIPQKEIFNVEDVTDNIFQLGTIAVWAKLYKRKFILDNNILFQTIKTCNDVYFNFMCLICAKRITFLDEELMTHRIEHSECLTKTRGKYAINILLAFKLLKKELKNKELFDKVKNSFYRKAYACFNYELSCIENRITRFLCRLKLFAFLPFKYYYKDILHFFFAVRNRENYKYVTILGVNIKIKQVDCVKKDQADLNPMQYPIALTDDEKVFFLESVKDAQSYLEFGSGGSTFLCVLETDIPYIVSVEGDNAWLDYIKRWRVLSDIIDVRLFFHYIDIGKVGDWSRPLDDSGFNRYPNYSKQIFCTENNFDVVFIDGRFRVACILQTIMNCHKNVKILVHDFNIRPEYHCVLEYLDVVKHVDSLYLFKIKDNVNLEAVNKMWDEYKHNYD